MEAIFVIAGFVGVVIVGIIIFLRQKKLVRTIKARCPEIFEQMQLSEQLLSQSPVGTSKLLGLILFRSAQREISDHETNSQISSLRKFYYIYAILFLTIFFGLIALFSTR